MSSKLLQISALLLGLSSLGAVATTGSVSDFNDAVTKAVLFSPRVNASWYNFEATREAERAARGGYLPSVDVTAEIGREDRDTPLVDLGTYTRDASRLSITQMLFDGFATREEVRRLGYSRIQVRRILGYRTYRSESTRQIPTPRLHRKLPSRRPRPIWTQCVTSSW